MDGWLEFCPACLHLYFFYEFTCVLELLHWNPDGQQEAIDLSWLCMQGTWRAKTSINNAMLQQMQVTKWKQKNMLLSFFLYIKNMQQDTKCMYAILSSGKTSLFNGL